MEKWSPSDRDPIHKAREPDLFLPSPYAFRAREPPVQSSLLGPLCLGRSHLRDSHLTPPPPVCALGGGSNATPLTDEPQPSPGAPPAHQRQQAAVGRTSDCTFLSQVTGQTTGPTVCCGSRTLNRKFRIISTLLFSQLFQNKRKARRAS